MPIPKTHFRQVIMGELVPMTPMVIKTKKEQSNGKEGMSSVY
jgi:hypothetical protein